MHRTRARSQSKVSGKAKTATPSAVASDVLQEFDQWAERQRRSTGCCICRCPNSAQTVDALLRAMVRKRAFKVTVHEIHRVVSERHTDLVIGQRSLERHLLTCVRGLYDQARGRIQ